MEALCIPDLLLMIDATCLFHFRSTSKLIFSTTLKQWSASKIQKWWKRLHIQKCANNFLLRNADYHSFMNRLSSNVQLVRCKGLIHLSRWMQIKRRFLVTNEKCPSCSLNDINRIVYFSIGYKMLKSCPWVFLLCDQCAEYDFDEEDEYRDEYYQKPRIFRLNRFV